MGRTFTNLQLRAEPERARDAVEAWLRAHQWTIVDDPGRATRQVLLGHDRADSAWVSCYDSALDGSDIDEVAPLAAELSRALDCYAVVLSVHDSDVLDQALYHRGQVLDRGSSWPGYFRGDAPPAQAVVVEPAAWAPLLDPSVDEGAFAARWVSNSGRAECALRDVATVLGWSADGVEYGYHSLPAPARSRGTMLYAAPSGPGATATAPALAECGGDVARVVAAVGEALAVRLIATNTGGALTGLSVVLFGEVIDDGLLGDIEIAARAEDTPVRTEPCPPQAAGDVIVRSAHFGALTVPAGFADLSEAIRRSGAQSAGVQAWMRRQVHIEVRARAIAAGSGELHIGLVPDENPDAGQTSWSVDVAIADSR